MVELELSDIPSEEIRTTLCDTIENKLKSKKYKINVSSASKVGENNFIGIIYRVTFKKEDEIENGKTSISKLILKVAPQNVARREQFVIRPAFLREIYTYDKILPFFRQFEESKGVIVEEDGFHEYPKCYRTLDSDINECLLLEDLSERGFKIIDRRTEEVTADHVHLVMKTLGKFHAISFALKDQQPEKFKEITSNLDEIFIVTGKEYLRDYFNKQAESVFNAVSDDDELLSKAKKFFERDAIDVAVECLDLKLTGSGSVISHGDAWQNNTMFTYDNNGKPIAINFLDWQIARHASPIIDIVYYMFSCTTKELRDAHYDEFLKVYHNSLSTHVRRLGSDPEKLFSYETMQEHFRKFAKFGLILSTALLPMITSDDGHGIDVDEMAESVQNGNELDAGAFISDKSRNKLNKRLRGVVNDMVRLGYI